MAEWHQRMIPVIVTTSLLLGAGTAATPVSDAAPATEEAVLVPGATVFKPINPLYPVLATTYPVIGINFHDDANPRVIDYSQDALDSDRAIADGVEQANIGVREVNGKVVVIGESMGSMVASRLAVELAGSAAAPSTDDIRFVLIAPPEAGVAEYFKEGTYIPILNYRISRVPESRYHTTIVIGEYDGWADPPDRPWNVVSLANAVLGIAFVHGPPIAAADPADVPPENTVIRTNSQGGTVVTHFVPTEDLPLTQPLRIVGIPDQIVDMADQVLRPIVDAGYVRHDEPGDLRPYFADGEIHRNAQSQQLAREPQPREGKPDESAPRPDGPRGGVEQVAEQLGDKIPERQADRAQRQAEREAARAEREAARAERRAEREAERASGESERP